MLLPFQVRQRPEKRQVFEVQIVAGVDAQPGGMRDIRGPGVDAERLEGFDRSALERPCVRFGVQLDTVGAGRGRKPDGLGRGIDKEADADAQGFQVADDLWQSGVPS